MKRYLLLATVMLLTVTGAGGEVRLTVYNSNLGLVRETREVALKAGTGTVSLDDVAALIDPSSVSMKLAGPGKLDILEQNFAYDLVSQDRLLEKYVGREIEIERIPENGGKREAVRGTLLSSQGGLVVKSGENRILLNPRGEISLPKLPDDLVLKPTLSWLVESDVAGTRPVEVAYLTGGITWSADYVAVLGKGDRELNLTGWVTIDNRSGAAFKDASLKLVAGDVNRLPQAGFGRGEMAADVMMAKAAAPQFQERSFFEYHLYTLQRKTTLKNNETKQIEFASAPGIPAKKTYLYDGASPYLRAAPYQRHLRAERGYGIESNPRVSVIVEFVNAKDRGLGIALPRGRVRVYQQDDDGSLEFVGEDAVDHTPKDEPVRLRLGDAFDFAGERTQTEFKCGDDWCEESFRIVLRNHKDEAVEIKAVEHLYRWSTAKIIQSSDTYSRKDSRTIEYTVKVPANGEKTVAYTVRYTW